MLHTKHHKNFDHLMLDLETMSTKSNAVISSIGVCRFDINTGAIGDTFYRNVDVGSCIFAGLVTDERTIKWWSEQSKEAKAALLDPKPVSLVEMCEGFRAWVKTMPKNQKLWGNGVGFDNTILRNAYDAISIPFTNVILRSAFDATEVACPIFFTKDMDVRTLVWMGKRYIKKNNLYLDKFVGIGHHALDDAIYQVGYTSRLYKAIHRM